METQKPAEKKPIEKCACTNKIINLEKRIANLEREISILRQVIIRGK